MKTIVTTLFLSFLSCCAFGQDKAAISAAEAACGPREVQFDITADKSQHPTPTPENGKALIYVVQENLGSTRVGADGKWLGGLQREGYFSVSIDPGQHPSLCHRPHWFVEPRFAAPVERQGGRDLLLFGSSRLSR